MLVSMRYMGLGRSGSDVAGLTKPGGHLDCFKLKEPVRCCHDQALSEFIVLLWDQLRDPWTEVSRQLGVSRCGPVPGAMWHETQDRKERNESCRLEHAMQD